MNKTCQNCKNDFLVGADDLSFYERMYVPAPKLCPDCRFQRRSLFRNEMSLYSRACDLCKARIISVYQESSPYVVYCQDCYDSDKWDPFSFALDYDKSKAFFEQLGDLMKRVPKRSLGNTSGSGPNLNSDYTNVSSSNKNCYLVFNTSACEDSMYSRGLKNCRDSVDTYFGVQMERCYEAINVHESSGIVFGQNITSSVDCWFGLNLSGCQNCFGCVNLTNKTDHWFNEPIARDEYARRLAEVRGSFSKMQEMQKKFQEFSLQFPRRQNNNTKSVNSVGDYLFECNNVSHCFEQTACEDCKFGFSNKNTKDSYDIIGYGYDSELLLDCCATGLSSRVIGSYFVESCHQVEYSFFIRNSHDCVGCDALKNGEYCILNEKYSKEEYESLRQHIIEELRSLGEYGLFMPPSIAPFAYNETIGQDNLPLTQAVAESYGYRWQPDAKRTTGKETILPEDLPNNIKGVSDSILKEVLRCTVCSRNYLITPAELAFYRDMNLPLPRKCFFCRHANRLERRGPMKIYQRVCAKCNKSIETPYAPERPETVYCESCYQEAVV